MSPYEIDLLMQFYMRPVVEERYPALSNELFDETMCKFEQNGLIVEINGKFERTERLIEYVRQLLSLPLPTREEMSEVRRKGTIGIMAPYF